MLKIRTFQNDDLQLLERWLHKEYIEKWFEVPNVCTIDDWLYEVKNRDGEFAWINYFIVLWEDCPIGFCCYYRCVDAKEDWYGNTPLDGAYSIDYLIGEESYLGKGLGKKMVAELVKMILHAKNAKSIIVQPDKRNKVSCNILLSNGFILDESNNIYNKSTEVKKGLSINEDIMFISKRV